MIAKIGTTQVMPFGDPPSDEWVYVSRKPKANEICGTDGWVVDNALAVINERNRLLADSDGTAMMLEREMRIATRAGNHAEERKIAARIELWDTYCQDVFEVKNQEGFPDDVIWPTEPDLNS